MVPPQPRLVTVILSHLGWIFPLLGQLFIFSFLCCLGGSSLGRWDRLPREINGHGSKASNSRNVQSVPPGTEWDSWGVLSSQELDSAILVGSFLLRLFHGSCGFLRMPKCWKCHWEQGSERQQKQK